MSQPSFSEKQLEAMRSYDQEKSQEKKVMEEPIKESEIGQNEKENLSKGLTPKQIEAMKSYDSQRGVIQKQKNESMWDTLKDWGKTAARGFAKIAQGVGNTGAMTDVGGLRQGAASGETNKNLMKMAMKTILPQTENKNISPKIQEIIDETAETFGEILPMALTGGAGSLASSLGREALAAAGGSAARNLVETAGGGSKSQAAAKIGTMLMISMFNPSAGAKLKDALYDEANTFLSKQAKAYKIPKPMLEELEKLANAESYGQVLPSEKQAVDLAKDFFKRVEPSSGHVPVDQLTKFKRAINENRETLWGKPELKGIQPSVKRNLDGLAHQADRLIDDYGKANPAFYEPWKRAEAIHQTIKWGDSLAKNIDKISKYAVPLSAIGGPTKFAGAVASKYALKKGAKAAASLAGAAKNKDLMKIAIDYGIKGLDLPSLEDLIEQEEKPKKKR